MLEKGGVTFIEHGFFFIITADAPKGRKLCTLKSNVLYFRLLKTADLERRVKRRLEQQRSKEVIGSMSILISQEGEKVWGRRESGTRLIWWLRLWDSSTESTLGGTRSACRGT